MKDVAKIGVIALFIVYTVGNVAAFAKGANGWNLLAAMVDSAAAIAWIINYKKI